jgi:hypothetical protein
MLTHAGGVESFWDTRALPSGRYQVVVEAEDFFGNTGGRAREVVIHDPALPIDTSRPDLGDLLVRDRWDDAGLMPSNLAGQPFWESPDIFIVPQGTPLTVDSDTPPADVTAEVTYDVYVRVFNRGCGPQHGVKARIFSANPAAIHTDWTEITDGTGFIGDPAHPEGIDLEAGEKALIGPFEWTPTAQEASMDGHRCLLAAVSGADDPTGMEQVFDAAAFNNVAQRNLQIGTCSYLMPNPTSTFAEISLDVSTDAQVADGTDIVEISFDSLPLWSAAWLNVEGADVREEGGKLIVRLLAQKVQLPTVPLVAAALQHLDFDLQIGPNGPLRTVTVAPRFNGKRVQGASCAAQGPVILP